jgi:hypothetical protein
VVDIKVVAGDAKGVVEINDEIEGSAERRSPFCPKRSPVQACVTRISFSAEPYRAGVGAAAVGVCTSTATSTSAVTIDSFSVYAISSQLYHYGVEGFTVGKLGWRRCAVRPR